MRMRSLVVPLAFVVAASSLVAAGPQPAVDDPGGGDDITRERGTADDAAKDALEGAPPPALRGKLWRNVTTPPRLTDHLGDVVVVQFWHVGSPAARDALVELDALQRKRADEGLVVVAVHPARDLVEAARFLAVTPLQIPLCVDAGPMETDYVVDGYPDAHLVDRFGVLRVADVADADLATAIDCLLAEPRPGGAPERAPRRLTPRSSTPARPLGSTGSAAPDAP